MLAKELSVFAYVMCVQRLARQPCFQVVVTHHRKANGFASFANTDTLFLLYHQIGLPTCEVRKLQVLAESTAASDFLDRKEQQIITLPLRSLVKKGPK